METEKAASESGKNGDEGKKTQTEEPPETPRSTRRSETRGGRSALNGTNDKTPGKEVDVNDEEQDNESEHADAEEPKYEV